MNKIEINEKLEVIIGTKEDLLKEERVKSPLMDKINERLPCTSYWMNKKFYILIQTDCDSDKDLSELFEKEYIKNCGYPRSSLYRVWNLVCSYCFS